MNMKLSYRDKVIFIVAIIIIILVAGFFLLIRPKFQEIEVAQNNYQTKVQERETVDAKIGTLPGIIENLKAVATEIGEEQEIFMTEQDPYLNETYIREALAGERIDITSMSTSYATAGGLGRYVVNPAHILAYDYKINADLYNELPQIVYDTYAAQAAQAAGGSASIQGTSYPSATIGVTTVTFTYRNDNISVDYNVIDRLAEDDKTIILNTISSSTEEPENGDPREVTCVVTMYSIFPLNVEQVLQESDEIAPIQTPAE